MKILVIGGTGLVGRQVVQALAADGHAVRATSRRNTTFPAGVEGAIVDLLDGATIRLALEDIDAVFAYAEPDTAPVLVEQLEAAAVRRLVLLSSADAAKDDPNDFNSRRHRQPESIVEDSALNWTFLRPVAFASNALFWKDQIRFTQAVRSAYPMASQSLIDPRDIGLVAAKALTSTELIGASPILTGPESLTQLRQVQLLSIALGRPITFESIPPDEMRTMLTPFLAPEYIELKLTALANAEREPDPVTDMVESITGKAPYTFQQWAEMNSQAFI